MTEIKQSLTREKVFVGMKVKVVSVKYTGSFGKITRLTKKQCDVQLLDAIDGILKTTNLPPRVLIEYNSDTESESITVSDQMTSVSEDCTINNAYSLQSLRMIDNMDTLDDVIGITPSIKHHLRYLTKEFKDFNIDCDSVLPSILMKISMKELRN